MTWCELPGFWLGHEVLQNYGCRLARGLAITLQLVAISVALGLVLGLGLALARLSRNPLLRLPAAAYIVFFRGTPLLGQLFLIYYGSGQFREFWQGIGLWSFFRDEYWCALLAFTMNTTAYQAEAWRGAIQAVGRGQREAAQALGLSRLAAFRAVIAPQALIIALRPLGNELITMIKASAVASLVSLYDLMGATRLAFARSFDLTIYLYTALIYLVLVEFVRRVWDRIEQRLTRHLAPR
jgi:polar amino acid transport system permease protein